MTREKQALEEIGRIITNDDYSPTTMIFKIVRVVSDFFPRDHDFQKKDDGGWGEHWLNSREDW